MFLLVYVVHVFMLFVMRRVLCVCSVGVFCCCVFFVCLYRCLFVLCCVLRLVCCVLFVCVCLVRVD